MAALLCSNYRNFRVFSSSKACAQGEVQLGMSRGEVLVGHLVEGTLVDASISAFSDFVFFVVVVRSLLEHKADSLIWLERSVFFRGFGLDDKSYYNSTIYL